MYIYFEIINVRHVATEQQGVIIDAVLFAATVTRKYCYMFDYDDDNEWETQKQIILKLRVVQRTNKPTFHSQVQIHSLIK